MNAESKPTKQTSKQERITFERNIAKELQAKHMIVVHPNEAPTPIALREQRVDSESTPTKQTPKK